MLERHLFLVAWISLMLFGVCEAVELEPPVKTTIVISSPVATTKSETLPTAAVRCEPTTDTTLTSKLTPRMHDNILMRSYQGDAIKQDTAEIECPPIELGKIYRFVKGIDSCVTPMPEQEIEQLLNDLFAQSVLRQNIFPNSVAKIVDAMQTTKFPAISYLVGDGGQVPISIAGRNCPRDFRYVVTWGPSENDAQVFMSAAPGGHSNFLQIIGWDDKNKHFNFFEFRRQVGQERTEAPRVWSWAGESSMAFNAKSRGKGCFDCHHNGVVIMKELERPWNNWNSELARIVNEVAPKIVTQESLFENKKGAEGLESVIKTRIQNYYRDWLRVRYQRQSDVAKLSDVNMMLRHLFTNTTVNFRSSQIQSRGQFTSPPNADISIPQNFLLWDDVLNTLLRLDYTLPQIKLKRGDYDDFIKRFDYRLEQLDTRPEWRYTDPGSTWFSIFIPGPAEEDRFMVTQLLNDHILPDKFIAAAVMVDFHSPVFSKTRASLQKYANQITMGTIDKEKNTIVEQFIQLIHATVQTQPPCTPPLIECTAEQQFLKTWNLPDDAWKKEVETRIQAYLDTLGQLNAEQQLDFFMRRAAELRHLFEITPVIKNLNEFSLLIPKTDLESQD